MTLQLSQKEIDAWQEWIYNTTPDTAKAAPATPAQTVTNIYFIDNSINIQAVMSGSPARLVDSRQRLAETAMDVTARRLASPMTARDQALLKEQAGYTAGYR